jgi:hypothetical protein
MAAWIRDVDSRDAAGVVGIVFFHLATASQSNTPQWRGRIPMKDPTMASSADEGGNGFQDDLVSALSPLKLHNRAPWNNVVCAMLVYFSRDVVQPIAESTDWNLFLTSIGIGLAAFISMLARGNVSRNYLSGINVVAGVWLVASTRIFPTSPQLFWAQVCLGILTTSIALTSLANELSAA